MEDIHDCPYHIFLTSLTQEINEKLDEHYNWQFFDLWLGDDSNFGGVYRESFILFFNLITNIQLTHEQLEMIENKGRNLENTMSTWLQNWKINHPNLPNEKMPLSCLKHKVYEYISYQLRKADMRALVGNPC